MINDDNEYLSAVRSAQKIIDLINYARSCSDLPGLNNQLAGALLFANTAELTASNISRLIGYLPDTKIIPRKRNTTNNNGKHTNLSSTISKLEDYEFFKNKNIIMPLLKKINLNRDNLFHNILMAHEENIDVLKICKEIRTDTEELQKIRSQLS